jgi:hypothetical protein
MPRRFRYSEETALDVFEAIKRAYIRQGFIPRRRRVRHAEPLADESPPPAAKSHKKLKAKAEPEDTDAHPADEDPERLLDITTSAHDILFEAHTTFPFTLFPDTITLDREKLTIANRSFFRVAKIISIAIADIVNVEADVGPFFGSIHVSSRNISVNPNSLPYSVNFLTRDAALRIHRLVQGYIIANQRDVDSSSIEKEQLIVLLNDLGQGVSD